MDLLRGWSTVLRAQADGAVLGALGQQSAEQLVAYELHRPLPQADQCTTESYTPVVEGLVPALDQPSV